MRLVYLQLALVALFLSGCATQQQDYDFQFQEMPEEVKEQMAEDFCQGAKDHAVLMGLPSTKFDGFCACVSGGLFKKIPDDVAVGISALPADK